MALHATIKINFFQQPKTSVIKAVTQKPVTHQHGGHLTKHRGVSQQNLHHINAVRQTNKKEPDQSTISTTSRNRQSIVIVQGNQRQRPFNIQQPQVQSNQLLIRSQPQQSISSSFSSVSRPIQLFHTSLDQEESLIDSSSSSQEQRFELGIQSNFNPGTVQRGQFQPIIQNSDRPIPISNSLQLEDPINNIQQVGVALPIIHQQQNRPVVISQSTLSSGNRQSFGFQQAPTSIPNQNSRRISQQQTNQFQSNFQLNQDLSQEDLFVTRFQGGQHQGLQSNFRFQQTQQQPSQGILQNRPQALFLQGQSQFRNVPSVNQIDNVFNQQIPIEQLSFSRSSGRPAVQSSQVERLLPISQQIMVPISSQDILQFPLQELVSPQERTQPNNQRQSSTQQQNFIQTQQQFGRPLPQFPQSFGQVQRQPSISSQTRLQNQQQRFIQEPLGRPLPQLFQSFRTVQQRPSTALSQNQQEQRVNQNQTQLGRPLPQTSQSFGTVQQRPINSIPALAQNQQQNLIRQQSDQSDLQSSIQGQRLQTTPTTSLQNDVLPGRPFTQAPRNQLSIQRPGTSLPQIFPQDEQQLGIPLPQSGQRTNQNPIGIVTQINQQRQPQLNNQQGQRQQPNRPPVIETNQQRESRPLPPLQGNTRNQIGVPLPSSPLPISGISSQLTESAGQSPVTQGQQNEGIGIPLPFSLSQQSLAQNNIIRNLQDLQRQSQFRLRNSLEVSDISSEEIFGTGIPLPQNINSQVQNIH